MQKISSKASLTSPKSSSQDGSSPRSSLSSPIAYLVKKLSFTNFNALADNLAVARDPNSSAEDRKKAIQQVRFLSEKIEPKALIRNEGLVELMVKTIADGAEEEKMWAIFVLKHLCAEQETAVTVLERSDALPALANLLEYTITFRRSNIASVVIQRCLDVILSLTAHALAQALMVRSDVFRALESAMGTDVPAEVGMALKSYHTLVRVALHAGFLSVVAGTSARDQVNSLSTSTKLGAAERVLAKEVVGWFDEAGGV
jgi:hypothetical protein